MPAEVRRSGQFLETILRQEAKMGNGQSDINEDSEDVREMSTAGSSAPKRPLRKKSVPEPKPEEISHSSKIRAEGNQLFALAKDETIAPVLRKARFQSAISKYGDALKAAQRHEDIASAAKNIAIANWKLANLLDVSRKDEALYMKCCLKEALTYFSKSHNCAFTTKCKDSKWRKDLSESFEKCVEESLHTVQDLEFTKKMASMEEYIYLVEHDKLRAKFCLEIGNMYFHRSISELAKADFKTCLRYLHECYRPIEEAERAAKLLRPILKEVNVLKEDVRLNTYTAESRQAISIGDKLYDEYELEESDDTSKGAMIWEVLDWYKQAVVLTRECEVEVEAIATSRIGRVYDRVLNMKAKARESFKKAIQLAMSMHPRTFTSDAWFKECTETLEEYQKKQVEQEDVKWNQERQKYIEELKDVLEELKEKAKKDDVEFLKFLYEKHPPTDGRYKLPKDLPAVEDGYPEFNNGLKGVLRKAVIHYHPDRCDVNIHGEKRKVLNEEVTKMLTKRYECLK